MIAPEQKIRIAACGDTAVTVEFGDRIDRSLTMRAVALGRELTAAGIPGIVEVVPTYRALLVHYDPLRLPYAELETAIRGITKSLKPAEMQGRSWTIPACYEGEAAPDIADVAASTGLTPSEVKSIHSSQEYFVYMVGFLPGFPYLGDLPEPLELKRRESPRLRVPRGSVAIALRMTGVYSLESPGGWHLIARTPVRFFDHRRREPALLRSGDKVRFAPVSAAEYARLETDVGAGRFTIEPDGAAA